jgi:hypothetical protein
MFSGFDFRAFRHGVYAGLTILLWVFVALALLERGVGW